MPTAPLTGPPRLARLPSLAEARAGLWAARAARQARRQVAAGAVGSVRLPSPHRIPVAGQPGVRAVLRRLSCPCLTVALVEQAWAAAHGEFHDVVIGVKGPSGGFSAHAWLDRPGRGEGLDGFQPLHRLAPPR